MTNWQIMFVAKVTLRKRRTRTLEQRGGESFNDFVERVERIFKDKDATIQVREVVGCGAGE